MTPPRAVIARVLPGTAAERHGLRPGDQLVSLNGQPIRDQIDYRFLCADGHLAVVARRGSQMLRFTAHLGDGGDLGLEFTEATFDGVRRCRNKCAFCFVDRLATGLRPTLYVKDDDYRYSFLFGSYVTLTNLQPQDWERIVRQRLSPLYVSVHAADLALRREMLGNPKAPDIMAQLRELSAAGIEVHAQVVLCPGLNDGLELECTVAELTTQPDCVRSVAIVPVGLTKHGPAGPLRRPTVTEMSALVGRVRHWQRECRRHLGRTFVHLADEFYLATGRPLPAVSAYDGFPQFENGVGMARSLLSEWSRLKRRALARAADPRPVTAVCGALIEPLLRPIVAWVSEGSGVAIDLRVVANRFFGPMVNVSGLLTGADVIAALRGAELGRLVVLPRAMFDFSGSFTLDGLSVHDLQEALGAQVALCASIGDLVGHVVGKNSLPGGRRAGSVDAALERKVS